MMQAISQTASSSTLSAEQPMTSEHIDGKVSSSAVLPSQVISFAIDDDQYGVDIMAVREIKGWSNVTHLPKQPEYVRGVLNLRGVMVPIIDLRCRFGQGITESTPMHIVIIVQVDERQVGLLADRVLDIVSFEAGKIQSVPRIASNSRVSFLTGLVTIEHAMIALLDLQNLLSLQLNDGETENFQPVHALSAQR
jgi:purine-binding chemotaxis protein CheW